MTCVSEVNVYSEYYYEIYNSEEFVKSESSVGQFMIVDCGCPRGLMGYSEYEKLKQNYETETIKLNRKEMFRFGPSKTYSSTCKVRVPMMIRNSELCMDFFLVDAKIPILVGNDFLKPMGGSINIGEKQLEIKKIDERIEMFETPGGHFVIPLKNVAAKKEESVEDEEYHENLVGEEADAVMTILMVESEDENALHHFHNEVGHSVFLSLALNNNEKNQVDKVH